MSWFLVILFLSLTLGTHSEASHAKKLPSAVVVGTVYCDTCFQRDFSMGSHFISGASVAFSVSKHVRRIKGCTVKLISSSEPYCAVASAATSSSIRLKSRKQGLHIFSAGFFSFKPLKQPNLCNQKPSVQNIKDLGYVKSFFPPDIDPSLPPPLQDPNTPGGLPILPGLPNLPPLPPLPSVPPLPGIRTTTPWSPPVPGGKTNESPNVEPSDQKVAHPENLIFPPNPLFPPPIVPNPLQPQPLVPNPLQPSPLIPNPLQPPGQSSLVPNPFQPPSPTPLIPNPLQPPPSGPPPAFRFPFPPLFPPLGIPPSKNASP